MQTYFTYSRHKASVLNFQNENNKLDHSDSHQPPMQRQGGVWFHEACRLAHDSQCGSRSCSLSTRLLSGQQGMLSPLVSSGQKVGVQHLVILTMWQAERLMVCNPSLQEKWTLGGGSHCSHQCPLLSGRVGRWWWTLKSGGNKPPSKWAERTSKKGSPKNFRCLNYGIHSIKLLKHTEENKMVNHTKQTNNNKVQ